MNNLLNSIKGNRTFLLAALVSVSWCVRLFLLDDPLAAEVMDGVNVGAFLAGIGALLGASKYGTAKQMEAGNGSNA
jgi:hypothetical protein